MVQWNENCRVRFRECEYTDDETNNCWYTEEDIRSFKNDRKAIKELVRKLGTIELAEKTLGESSTCLGLERYVSRSKTQKRKERIRTAISVVRKIQEENRKLPWDSAEDAIATAYSQISTSSQKEANIQAFFNLARTTEESKIIMETTKSEEKQTSRSSAPLLSIRITDLPRLQRHS